MKCVAGRTNPGLWAQVKREAVRKMGRHSARAMQLAGRLYRQAGGGYCGKPTKEQKKMVKWTRERWRTAPGAEPVACHWTPTGQMRCDRYLPEAAWRALSPAQREVTRATKKRARKQYVPNAPVARAAGKRARAGK